MPIAKEWQLQEAKSRLSELVRQAGTGPQVITLRGKPSVAVIAYDEYRRLLKPKARLSDVMRTAPEGFAEACFERDKDATLRDVAI
ncbi:MAG: type II toxin-antitoxin system Phd/YefM family antitoxin [Coriobacteriales bacterium]|nr:type II toxin-antitoxin system Phd/YefM family antitoxin [Coriobacteriales bacterium]